MVAVFGVVAGGATVDMTTQGSRATLHNGLHGLLVTKKHVVTKLGTVS
jgi:hypothetical protein